MNRSVWSSRGDEWEEEMDVCGSDVWFIDWEREDFGIGYFATKLLLVKEICGTSSRGGIHWVKIEEDDEDVRFSYGNVVSSKITCQERQIFLFAGLKQRYALWSWE